MKTPITTLDNGAVCIFAEKKESHLAQIFVGFRVGSNNEIDGERGLAHFYEHMCFKGTKKYPTGKKLLDSLYSLGSVVNAFTSNGITAYYALTPSKEIYKAMSVMADMANNPLFPEEEIEKEKGVVLAEMKMYEDDPVSVSADIMNTQLYKGTPAEHPVLGYANDVSHITRERFVDFYNTYYTASNMVIVVAGNFDVQKAKKHTSSVFGDIQKGKKRKEIPIQANKKGKRVVVVSKKVEQCVVRISFPCVPVSSKESVFIESMVYILASGLSSRLAQRVREEMGACYYINGEYCSFGTSYGEIDFSAGIDVSRIKEVMLAIIEEIRLLKKECVGTDELKKLINNKKRSISTRTESTGTIAYHAFSSYIHFGKVKKEREMYKELQRITPEKIRNAAQRFLTTKEMRINVVGPVKNKKNIETFLKTLRI